MRSLCQLPVAKNHNFGQILILLGAPVPTPFYWWGPNLVDWSRLKVYTYPPNKFHLNVFIVSASGDQKPQFWANFDIFRSSFTDPLLPIRVKFGVLKQTQGLHLPAKFHLNGFIVSAPGGQKPQFWVNFDIWHSWALLYRPPFTDEGQIWWVGADPRSTLTR